MTTIPIPERMRHLNVDARGYAIPYGVVIDTSGTVHFAMNDERIRQESIKRDLCSLCGKRLLRGRWFVGGSLSAFHPNGAFIDPPMHYECSHYALQACPYLAAPHYVREIGPQKAKQAQENLRKAGIIAVTIDTTMMPGRPHGEIFIAICSAGQTVFRNMNTRPKLPFIALEYWKHGRMIERLTGPALSRRLPKESEAAMENAG